MKKWMIIGLCWIASLGSAQSISLFATEHSLDTFEWILRMIDHATQTVEISGCYFSGDVAVEVLEHVEQRLEKCPNLQVRVLFLPIFEQTRNSQLIKKLKEVYPEQFFTLETSTVTYATSDYGFIDNHVKYVIVDETYFTLGGTNLEDSLCTTGIEIPQPRRKSDFLESHLQSASRDQDVIVNSPHLAHQLRTHFYKSWALWEHYEQTKDFIGDLEVFTPMMPAVDLKHVEPIQAFENNPKKTILDQEDVELFYSSPFIESNPIAMCYAKTIHEAEESIFLGGLYFNPRPEITAALLEKIQQGLEIQIITNGIYPGHTPRSTEGFAWISRMRYFEFLYGVTPGLFGSKQVDAMRFYPNVSIYEYYLLSTIYHKKILVVDNHTVLIGSYNLNKKSDYADFEILLKIESPKLASQMMQSFDQDLKCATRVSAFQVYEWYFSPWYSFLRLVSERLSTLF